MIKLLPLVFLLSCNYLVNPTLDRTIQSIQKSSSYADALNLCEHRTNTDITLVTTCGKYNIGDTFTMEIIKKEPK